MGIPQVRETVPHEAPPSVSVAAAGPAQQAGHQDSSAPAQHDALPGASPAGMFAVGEARPPGPPGAPSPTGSMDSPGAPNVPGARSPKLLDLVREAIRTRHYSRRTETAYAGWIRRFILFNGKRHPHEMGEAEIGRFLSWLALDGKVSASTQNQALSALLFLYRDVLRQDVGWVDDVVRAKAPRRLPVVLTREEVREVLQQLDGSRWLMATLLYGAGLRLLECMRLRVKDLDFSANQIVVHGGKGNKDRLTMLPAAVKEPLKRHLNRMREMHEEDVRRGAGWVEATASSRRVRPPAGREGGRLEVGPHQAGDLSHTPAFLRDPPSRRRLRHPDRPGTSGTQRREHDHDLHARFEPRGPRRTEPGRPPMTGSVRYAASNPQPMQGRGRTPGGPSR